MSTSQHQRLALSVCDWLNKCLADGTLQAEEKESIDVAITCISDAFGVNASDEAAVAQATGPKSLAQIFATYEQLKNGMPSAGAKPSPSTSRSITDEQKKQAEALKSKGNAALAQKDTATAIDFYTQALAIDSENPIYLSNRAAAYSQAKKHDLAQKDAERAVEIDPNYTKAWSRLGLARFAQGDAEGAMNAYQKGIEHEGNGGSDAMKKGYETAKRRVEELQGNDDGSIARDGGGLGGGLGGGAPNLANLASMFGGGAGGGRGGGGGGMPDLSSIMSNPMFASMAQNLMSNPDMMNNLMSNPRLREMANQVSGGGGMPDLGSLMSDPNIAEMARNLMGGGGRGGGAGGAGSGNEGR